MEDHAIQRRVTSKGERDRRERDGSPEKAKARSSSRHRDRGKGQRSDSDVSAYFEERIELSRGRGGRNLEEMGREERHEFPRSQRIARHEIVAVPHNAKAFGRQLEGRQELWRGEDETPRRRRAHPGGGSPSSFRKVAALEDMNDEPRNHEEEGEESVLRRSRQ